MDTNHNYHIVIALVAIAVVINTITHDQQPSVGNDAIIEKAGWCEACIIHQNGRVIVPKQVNGASELRYIQSCHES